MMRSVAAITVAVASVGLTLPALAQTGTPARDLSAAARVSVAQALYAASATSAATERAADARFTEQRRQIESLRTQGEAARARGAAAAVELQAMSGEVTALQERYVTELAARDRAYAQEIAMFRTVVTDIASTPEGE